MFDMVAMLRHLAPHLKMPRPDAYALEPRQLKGDLLDLRLAHYGTLQQISNSRIPIREMA